jgi:hypothetical protein
MLQRLAVVERWAPGRQSGSDLRGASGVADQLRAAVTRGPEHKAASTREEALSLHAAVDRLLRGHGLFSSVRIEETAVSWAKKVSPARAHLRIRTPRENVACVVYANSDTVAISSA